MNLIFETSFRSWRRFSCSTCSFAAEDAASGARVFRGAVVANLKIGRCEQSWVGAGFLMTASLKDLWEALTADLGGALEVCASDFLGVLVGLAGPLDALGFATGDAERELCCVFKEV